MRYISLISVLIIALALAFGRLAYINWNEPGANVLTSDAFGYYLYLPGKYIHHDLTKLTWLPEILDKYRPTGNLYQVIPLENGNFAMKYLMGLSIIYTPFFFLGHCIAGALEYPQDGFSTPYPLSICFGAWVYAVLGFFLLRKVMLHFFSDAITAVVLLLIAMATNYPQYVVVDSAMTHGFLFMMYALLLWITVGWVKKPNLISAFLLGGVIGLSCITRPTEAVMLIIPLFWKMPDGKPVWSFFRRNASHLRWALLGGFLGILPQLWYWKSVTGKWIFDVGSKFLFFRPHWQVLFGWEKGWFIYTPIAILMITGLFLQKKYPFGKAISIFTFFNIWIIIAWSDWRYGASYSCRAIIQSYPVMALPLALTVGNMLSGFKKYVFPLLLVFFTFLNIFQIWQYNSGVLHYNDMNRHYYQAIFLNANPSPVDMSLLDTEEVIKDQGLYSVLSEIKTDSIYLINKNSNGKAIIIDTMLNKINGFQPAQEQWFHITAQVLSAWGAFDTRLELQVSNGQNLKRTACRMHNGISNIQGWNTIEFFFRIPENCETGQLVLFSETTTVQDIYIRNVVLHLLSRK